MVGLENIYHRRPHGKDRRQNPVDAKYVPLYDDEGKEIQENINPNARMPQKVYTKFVEDPLDRSRTFYLYYDPPADVAEAREGEHRVRVLCDDD